MSGQLAFHPAIKRQSLLRLALYGPPGGGKTMTMLALLLGLAGGDPAKFGVIDTEQDGAAEKYAHKFGQFQHLVLPNFTVDNYLTGVKLAGEAGLPNLGIDSFSHAWEGDGGILEHQSSLDSPPGTGWNKVRPHEKRLWNGVLSAPHNMIVTMRSRNEMRVWEENGKQKREIVGLEPVQRKGLHHEFDVVALMKPVDDGVEFCIEKTRYGDQLPRGLTLVFKELGDEAELVARIQEALAEGEPPIPATDEEIKLLTSLLDKEGLDKKRVKDVMDSERSRNLGVLPQDWVRRAIERASARLNAKPDDKKPDEAADEPAP